MCESNVYSVGKSDQPLMSDVVLVTVDGDQIRLRGILGSEKIVRGKLVKIDLLNHRLFIEEQ